MDSGSIYGVGSVMPTAQIIRGCLEKRNSLFLEASRFISSRTHTWSSGILMLLPSHPFR